MSPHPLSVILLAAAAAGVATPAVSAQHAPDRQVVLTFDDLPMTGASLCDSAAVQHVTEALTGYLKENGLPALGLATSGRPCLTPALLGRTLQRWADVGAEIGNHTAHHPDLNGMALGPYLDDLDLGQRLIDDVVENRRRWFRPPYLHMGNEPGKKAGLLAHLAEHRYRLAPVTVDNQEWVYAAVYAEARARRDSELARRVADGYVRHLEESMAFYETLSDRVFGRQIPQVLLLHANLLNADALGRIDAMLRGRGYRYVEMAVAVSDPAYRSADEYVGPRGLSWLQRWARAQGVTVPEEPREADWVARAYRSIRQPGGAGPSRDTTALAAITAASRAFSAAYVRGDTAAIRALYWPDAVLLPPEGDVAGVDAIVRYFAPGPGRVNLNHSMQSDSIHVSGELATDVGTWTNTWRSGSGPVRSASGRYLVVWGRTPDGAWRMRYDLWHRPAGR